MKIIVVVLKLIITTLIIITLIMIIIKMILFVNKSCFVFYYFKSQIIDEMKSKLKKAKLRKSKEKV